VPMSVTRDQHERGAGQPRGCEWRRKDAHGGVICDLENEFFGCRVPFDGISRLDMRMKVKDETRG